LAVVAVAPRLPGVDGAVAHGDGDEADDDVRRAASARHATSAPTRASSASNAWMNFLDFMPFISTFAR
jgi:hypothetical protein